jgi:hypothetical protein
MRQLLITFVLLAFFVHATAGASGTKVVTTWRGTNVGPINFKKVVVAFLNRDTDLRHRVEDGLARRVRRSVAAHTFVPDSELRDQEAVKARLSSNEIDGAIVVRLAEVARDVIVSPGGATYTTYPMFWDMWGTGWGVVSTPTLAFEEKVVTAEIIVYSVATAKPIWAGRLKATNPKSLRVLLDDLVKAGSAELRKQKLV